jgi:hypothetical protein
MLTTYQGLFQHGKTEQEMITDLAGINDVNKYVIRCLHDNTKYQLGFSDVAAIDYQLSQTHEAYAINKIKTIFDKTRFSEKETKDFLLSLNPKLENLFQEWENTPLKHFELSDVGIVIAHANLRRRIRETYDLSNWIK